MRLRSLSTFNKARITKNRLIFDDSFFGRAVRRAENSAMYSDEGLAWVLDTGYATDSVCLQHFVVPERVTVNGLSSGTGAPAMTPEMSITAPDSATSMTAGKTCAASRFFELELRAENAVANLKLAVGVAFLEKYLPACLSELEQGAPDKNKATKLCEPVFKMARPKYNAALRKTARRKTGALEWIWIPSKHPPGKALEEILITRFNCLPSTVPPVINGGLNDGVNAEENVGADTVDNPDEDDDPDLGDGGAAPGVGAVPPWLTPTIVRPL